MNPGKDCQLPMGLLRLSRETVAIPWYRRGGGSLNPVGHIRLKFELPANRLTSSLCSCSGKKAPSDSGHLLVLAQSHAVVVILSQERKPSL